jgi:hypothetical protein
LFLVRTRAGADDEDAERVSAARPRERRVDKPRKRAAHAQSSLTAWHHARN